MSKSLLQQLDEEFGLGLKPGQDERRIALRRACVAPAILVPVDAAGARDEDGRRDGIALDVSEGGVRVVSKARLEAPALEIRIPRAEAESIVLVGDVVRFRELASGYTEYGLRLRATGT